MISNLKNIADQNCRKLPGDKINIIHFRDSLGVHGAERVILTLGKHIDTDRFNFTLLCLRRYDGRSEKLIKRARELGIYVIPIDVRGKMDVLAIADMRNVLKNANIALCHAHDYKSVFYARLASIKLGIKLVVTAHGSTRDSLVKKIYLLITERIMYKFVDKIIAVSEDIAKQLQKQHIDPEHIEVVQNGIDLTLMSNESEKRGDEQVVSADGRKVFAVVGRLFLDKGHKYFLDAFSNVHKQYPLIKGFIVGDGPARDAIIKQIDNLGLQEHVLLLGERSDMKAIYDSIDVLVIPSLREGLPYVLLEAMSCKIPVIATAVGDIPVLIKNDHTGYLVGPRDAKAIEERMIDIMLMMSKSHEMVENAYSLIMEKYNAEQMVRKTENIYTRIINKSK